MLTVKRTITKIPPHLGYTRSPSYSHCYPRIKVSTISRTGSLWPQLGTLWRPSPPAQSRYDAFITRMIHKSIQTNDPVFFDLMLGGLRLLLSHDRGKMLSLKWSMDQFALGSIFRWNCRLRLRQCQRSGIMESESGQTGSLLRVTITKDDFCYSWRGSTSCG